MELFLFGVFVPACAVLAAMRAFQGGIARNIALFFPLIALANFLAFSGNLPIVPNVAYSFMSAAVISTFSYVGHRFMKK